MTIELSNGGAIHISTKKYPQRRSALTFAEAGGIKPDIEAHNTEKGYNSPAQCSDKSAELRVINKDNKGELEYGYRKQI